MVDHDNNMSAKFCLKWNNFGRNVTSSFKHLLETEDFVDISLSAQGKTLKAHKVVLSASSPYFKDLLQDIPYWQHPVVLLRDVPYSDLQGIVEFIYHGEVSVDQDNLPSFLQTAQALRVKGLTDDNASAGAPPASSATPNGAPSALNHQNSKSAKNVMKNEILTKQQQLQLQQQEEEIDDVEDEEEELEMSSSWASRVPSNFHGMASNPFQNHNSVKAIAKSSGNKQKLSNHHHPRKSANPKRANVLKALQQQQQQQQIEQQDYSEESEQGIFAGEIDDREEEEIQQQEQQQQQHAAAVAAAAAAANNLMAHFLTSTASTVATNASSSNRATPPTAPNRNFKEEMDTDDGLHMADGGTDDGSGTSSPLGFNPKSNKDGSQKKTCPFCQQQLSWHALSRHIRDMHKNNQQGFVTCKFCGKMFRNKNSLGCHMWRFHKEKDGAKSQKQPQQPQDHQEAAKIENRELNVMEEEESLEQQ